MCCKRDKKVLHSSTRRKRNGSQGCRFYEIRTDIATYASIEARNLPPSSVRSRPLLSLSTLTLSSLHRNNRPLLAPRVWILMSSLLRPNSRLIDREIMKTKNSRSARSTTSPYRRIRQRARRAWFSRTLWPRPLTSSSILATQRSCRFLTEPGYYDRVSTRSRK